MNVTEELFHREVCLVNSLRNSFVNCSHTPHVCLLPITVSLPYKVSTVL